MFNFGDHPEVRTVSLAALGLTKGSAVTVFEFWEEKFLGICHDKVEITLPAQNSRILIIRRLTGRPQLIGTDMHLLSGYHEVSRLGWDEDQATLSGEYRRATGLSGKAYIYVPTGFRPGLTLLLRQSPLRWRSLAMGCGSTRFNSPRPPLPGC